MSARANAPVFQLHPSATGTGMSSPSQVPVIPAPASHGFTPANAQQLIPNPAPMPPQHHQALPSLQHGSMHMYHQRTDSGSSHGRRRNSSLSRRRADPRLRSSVPPQLAHPLPQIHASTAEDLVSGARTAPVPDMQPILKREGESSGYIEPYQKRRREDDGQGLRSPDRVSQRSATGSTKSMKREPEESERTSAVSSPLASAAR